jgi:DNA-binding transcriptional regulator LsrR (DeoR family)
MFANRNWQKRDRVQMQQDKRTDYARRLDDLARAGWRHYVAGCKRDEIAQKLHVSNQTVQRLVSMATKEN